MVFKTDLGRRLHELNRVLAGVSKEHERTDPQCPAVSAHTVPGAPIRTVEKTAIGAPKIISLGPDLGPQGKTRTGKKRSKLEKAARRAARLKGSLGYVQYMQYYANSETGVLASCNTNWILREKGEKKQVHGIGCGQRDLCPWCGEYTGLVLARDALSDIGLMLKQLAGLGFEADSGILGLKFIATIPKELSQAIDKKLFDGQHTRWSKDVAMLYELQRTAIRELVGPGWAGLQSMDFTGESDPLGAHYHTNAWISPARQTQGEWIPVPHWFEKEDLAKVREHYTESVNKAFGTDFDTCDIKISYIDKQGDLTAWIQYLYKHQLHDLWSGWQNFKNGELVYKYNIKGEWFTLQIPQDDLKKAFDRLQLIPAHHKRVRWAGYLSDGQRGRQFELLGLVKDEKEDTQGDDTEGWTETALKFVRFLPEGVVLQDKNGEKLFFSRDLISWKPGTVSTGRRIRWRVKGQGPDPPGPAAAAPRRSYGFSWEKDENIRRELEDTIKRYAA